MSNPFILGDSNNSNHFKASLPWNPRDEAIKNIPIVGTVSEKVIEERAVRGGGLFRDESIKETEKPMVSEKSLYNITPFPESKNIPIVLNDSKIAAKRRFSYQEHGQAFSFDHVKSSNYMSQFDASIPPPSPYPYENSDSSSHTSQSQNSLAEENTNSFGNNSYILSNLHLFNSTGGIKNSMKSHKINDNASVSTASILSNGSASTSLNTSTGVLTLSQINSKKLLNALQHKQLWLVSWILDKQDSREFLKEKNDVTFQIWKLLIQYGELPYIRKLIEIGADPTIKSRNGHTLLDEAHYFDKPMILEYLEQQIMNHTNDSLSKLIDDFDINELKEHLIQGLPLPDADNLLFRAASLGDLGIVRILIAVGYNLNAINSDGHTAKEVALMHGHKKVFEALSSENNYSSFADGGINQQYTSADSSSQNNNRINKPSAPVHGVYGGYNRAGGRGIYGGGRYSANNTFSQKYTNNANVTPKTKIRQSPLHDAAEQGSLTMVRFLCKSWPIEVLNHEQNTPLHLACRHGHLDIVRYLIEIENAKVNITNQWGSSPLAEAMANGHDNIAQFLNESGASLHCSGMKQYIFIGARDIYILKLEVILTMFAQSSVGNSTPNIVRFFHRLASHNSLLLCNSVRPREKEKGRKESRKEHLYSTQNSFISSSGKITEINDDFDRKSNLSLSASTVYNRVNKKREMLNKDADRSLSSIVLDARDHFLESALSSVEGTVIENASTYHPNDLVLAPIISYLQQKHLCIFPLKIDDTLLGCFLCLSNDKKPPIVPKSMMEEIKCLISCEYSDLIQWTMITTNQRLRIFLYSRLMRTRAREWLSFLWNQDSYIFDPTNRLVCDFLNSLALKPVPISNKKMEETLSTENISDLSEQSDDLSFDLFSIAQDNQLIKQLIDTVFYQAEVLLPINPSRMLFSVNTECCEKLKRHGFQPNDYSNHDSHIFSLWKVQVQKWIQKMEKYEASLQDSIARLQENEKPVLSPSHFQKRSLTDYPDHAVLTPGNNEHKSNSLIKENSVASDHVIGYNTKMEIEGVDQSKDSSRPVLDARDLFEIIGNHSYDATEILNFINNFFDSQTEDEFAWYDLEFCVEFSQKLSGYGEIRENAVLGVVKNNMYRTFIHHKEIRKAFSYLTEKVSSMFITGRPLTAVFIFYRSLIELHCFQDGNGRFARVMATILLKESGFVDAKILSSVKIPTEEQFFKIVSSSLKI